jgi:hypothetical protein
MKAILKFNLPEDSSDFLYAINGVKMKSILWDMKEYFRDELKYKDLNEDEYKTLEKASEFFWNFVKIAILIFMTSCMSQKKLAKTCAERFPINDSTVIIERVDTTYQYVQGDSIRVPFYVQGKVIYKDTICPPVKVANVSKVKEKHVYVENTAKIQHLENVNSKLTQDLNDSQQDVAKLEAKNKELAEFKRQVTFGGLLIIILLVLYKTRRLWL